MSAAKQLLDHKLLTSLSPLCDLTPDMLTELTAKSQVEQVVAGATIFKRGDRDHRALYLLSGKLELTDASGRTTMLAAQTKQARQPLDPGKLRTLTALAKTSVTLLNIDTTLLEMLLNWRDNRSYEVSNLDVQEDDETDWMSRFLQSKVFLKLRAESIQSMLMRMEEMQVSAGKVIIEQGDIDDNYYIIAKGRAEVARRATPDVPFMKLAILDAGTGFGEEALISNGERNATVTMLEDGRLMRLTKKDFIDLLVTPILQYVSYEQAQQMQGTDVQWLDVRKLDEYSSGSLSEAKNMPLVSLRLGLRKLNKLHKYIVFSNNEDRAAAAVFLLNQQGLEAFVLTKGLNALPESKRVKSIVSQVADTEAELRAPVVNLRSDEPAKTAESDGRVEALMHKAKQRVQQEMQRAQVADNARKLAQEEVIRLRAEAEVACQQAEDEARRAADQARSETERELAQQRAEELAHEQTEREEAVHRAEAEATRAALAEKAQQKAEAEIERIRQEAVVARREGEEQTRRVAENAKKETENEIARLKAEAEFARQQAEKQASLVDQARSEAERDQAQQRIAESNRYQQDVEDALHKAELEGIRAQRAEAARLKAEEEAERMRQRAEETQREMEEQARLAADQARSEAEREAARVRAEELACKQEELEQAVSKAEMETQRAQVAEDEVERLKQQAEEARRQAEELARLAADQARSEAEREMARVRAEEMTRLQAEREEVARSAEEEARRARAAEAARQQAEAEIQRLKVDAEMARMQLEEQAQRIADVARSDADRACAAEEARLQAETELERLATEVEQTRLAAQEQARLAADQARSEAEREAARVRAEELAQQQAQLEEVARRAEEETVRAQLADEARQRAEREIARRQVAAEEAARRAKEEAQRAREAEEARQRMEAEIEQLRAEAEAARIQMEEQTRRFAAAQAGRQADQQSQRRAAEKELHHKQEAEKRERLTKEEVERKRRVVEEAARIAHEEAERANQVAEAMRRQTEEEILRLQTEAEAARLKVEIENKRGIAAARRQVEQRAQAKACKLAALQQRKKVENQKAAVLQQRKKVENQKARRAYEARKAALDILGQSSEDLDEFFSLVEETATDVDAAIVIDEADIAVRAKKRENLIDPRQNTPAQEQEQKRQWVSDDFSWQASLGYRDDPDIEAIGSPADSVGAPEPSPEPKPEQMTEEPAPTDTTSHFKIREIDRSIRPQAIKPSGYSRRNRKWLVTGLLVASLVVTGGGWFLLVHPTQLQQVMDKTFAGLKEKTGSTVEETDNDETRDAMVKSQPDAERVDEAAMAHLRERLKDMRAEAAKKKAADKLAESTAVLRLVDGVVSSPESRLAPKPEEKISDVPQALSVPKPKVVPESRLTTAPELVTARENTVSVVESVEALPVLSEPARVAATPGDDEMDIQTIEGVLIEKLPAITTGLSKSEAPAIAPVPGSQTGAVTSMQAPSVDEPVVTGEEGIF